VKRTVRVPAISSKIADIPPDEYSWRKYGQKPIKGSPYPRWVMLILDRTSCWLWSWKTRSLTLIFLWSGGITSAARWEGVPRGSTWSAPQMIRRCWSWRTKGSTGTRFRPRCRRTQPEWWVWCSSQRRKSNKWTTFKKYGKWRTFFLSIIIFGKCSWNHRCFVNFFYLLLLVSSIIIISSIISITITLVIL